MSNGPAGHVARSTVRPNSETTGRVPIRTFLRTADGVAVDSVYDPGQAVYDASLKMGAKALQNSLVNFL